MSNFNRGSRNRGSYGRNSGYRDDGQSRSSYGRNSGYRDDDQSHSSYGSNPGYRDGGGQDRRSNTDFQYRGRGRGGRGRGGGGSSNYSRDDNTPLPESQKYDTRIRQKLQPGTLGTPIELIGNFYQLITSDITFYHYHVDMDFDKNLLKDVEKLEIKEESTVISDVTSAGTSAGTHIGISGDTLSETPKDFYPEPTPSERFIKKFSSKIMEQFVVKNGSVFTSNIRHIYDGFNNLYTTKRLSLENVNEKINVEIDGRVRWFVVKPKLVRTIHTSEVSAYYSGKSPNNAEISTEIISAYEIFFNFIMSKLYEPYQRKWFDISTQESMKNIQICELVRGFFSSVRKTEFGLALNVHLKSGCIISQSIKSLRHLVDAIINKRDFNLEQNQLNQYQFKSVNKIVRHLKIFTCHASKTKKIGYTVDRLINQTPEEHTFTRALPDGKQFEISIKEYFFAEYGIQLKRLPLVKTTGKRPQYLPLEHCLLMETQFLSNSKLNAEIQQELLRKSTVAPNVYFKNVQRIMDKVSKSDESLYRDFGINLSTKPANFMGRVLPSPKLLPENSRGKFYHSPPATVAIFCIEGQHKDDIGETQLAQFAKELEQNSTKFCRIKLKVVIVAMIKIQTSREMARWFANVVTDHKNINLLIVGIPVAHQYNPAMLYNGIKHYGDQKYGLVTQCFKTSKVKEVSSGYLENFLLKINGKIGGQNSVLSEGAIRQISASSIWNNTMLVGIDVNHPGETEKVMSSIAVAVGSLDPIFSRYSASIRVQKKEREEMLRQLDSMMDELLKQYMLANNNSYPRNVVVFRDGVSEGQFAKVCSIEIPLIQKAINKVAKNVKLTVIVVQKRHHTRFVRAQPITTGRNPIFNVPSGTVVDQSIVDPTYKMFYLNSHFSPMGTSKPTKYVLLRDDLHLSTNDLQSLCLLACHNCIRTRGVISIPTPVRYADLCAYRSKLHIELQREWQISVQSDREEQEAGIIRRLNESVKIRDELKNQLYYC